MSTAFLGQRLSSDVALCIAEYMDEIQDFFRMWVAFGAHKFFISKNDTSFWDTLLRCYLRRKPANFMSIHRQNNILNRSMGYNLVVSLFKERRCSRSGCLHYYKDWDNGSYSCRYHTGHMKPNGKLSCCGGEGFKSPGCKENYHDGVCFSMMSLTHPGDSKSPTGRK